MKKKLNPPPRPKLNTEKTRFISLSDYQQLKTPENTSMNWKMVALATFLSVSAAAGIGWKIFSGETPAVAQESLEQSFTRSAKQRVPASAQPPKSTEVIYDSAPVYDQPWQPPAENFQNAQTDAPPAYDDTYFPPEYTEPEPEQVMTDDPAWEQ